MELFEKIEKQANILREFIQQQVDSDYVYIDVPLYHNIGDWLIALGAWELLKESPYKCIAKLRWDDYYTYEINENTIILLQGGGNFGDLYRGATVARNELISRYLNNKIIILPQTITYIDKNLIEYDANLMAQHPNLHICTRDNVSYELANSYFKLNHIHLLPDSAVGLYNILPKYNGILTGKCLIINRLDKESNDLFNECGDIKEWKDILCDIKFNRVWVPYRILHKVQKMLHSSKLREYERIYTLKILYPYIYKYIPKYFLKYDCVKTTRLHGYLLALLLHLPVEIKDNKYCKINNYISTWLK